jgi:NAD(P)H-dependent FMN reductase
MHIQIIIGSVRQGRKAMPIGTWAHRLVAQRKDVSVEFVDLQDWNLPMFNLPKPPMMGNYEDALQRRWADKVTQGDAYIFVSPEYNHGYTAVLKNALDYLYGEWAYKPISFISYGSVGGARAVEQLRQVVIELKMIPTREALLIFDAGHKFKDDAFVGDAEDASQLDKIVDGLYNVTSS